MAVGDPAEDVGQVGERIDVVQLAGLDRGRDDGPMLGAAIGACEQSIFAGKLDRTDRTFDGVVVEFYTAIVDEPRQAFPSRQSITDGVGEFTLLADLSQLCAQPLLKCIGKWPTFLLPDETALLGAATADVLLDGVELADALERRAGDRRRARDRQFIEVTPHMRPAECELDIASRGELWITGITVDLQNALEPCEMCNRSIGFAVGSIDIGDARRIGSAPWPIVGGIGPQLSGLGAATAGIEHRHRGLVGEQFLPLPELDEQPLVQRTEVPG